MRRAWYIVAAVLLLGGAVRADQGWQDNQDGNNFACYDAQSFAANNLNLSGGTYSTYSSGLIVNGNPNASTTAWYVDPVSGNDNNNCTTNVTACKTFAQWNQRIAGAVGVATTVNVLNDVPDADAIFIDASGSVTIQGTETVVSTQTVTSAQPRTPASNLANEITVTGFDFSPYVGTMLRVQGTANYAAIIKAVSLGVARLGELWNTTTSAQASSTGIGAAAVIEIVTSTKGPITLSTESVVRLSVIDMTFKGTGIVNLRLFGTQNGSQIFQRTVLGGTSGLTVQSNFGIFMVGGVVNAGGGIANFISPALMQGTALTGPSLSYGSGTGPGLMKIRSMVAEATQINNAGGSVVHIDGDLGQFDIPPAGVGINIPGRSSTDERGVLSFNSGRHYGTGDATAHVWNIGTPAIVVYSSAFPPTNTAGLGVAINGSNVPLSSLPIAISPFTGSGAIDSTATAGCLQTDAVGNTTSTGSPCGSGSGTVTAVSATAPLFITGGASPTPNVVGHDLIFGGASTTAGQNLGSISTAPLGCVTSGGDCIVDGLTLAGGLHFDTGTGTETLDAFTCGAGTFVNSSSTSGLACSTPSYPVSSVTGANGVICSPTTGAVGCTIANATCGANTFVSSASSGSGLVCTQPAFSDLSGSATCAQLPALTGAVTSSAGSCATTIHITPTVCGATTFGTSINASGAISCSQPAFTDISGSWACSQSPAFTGDVTKASGSCATVDTNKGKIYVDATDAAAHSPDYLYPKLTSFTNSISFSPIGSGDGQVTIDVVPGAVAVSKIHYYMDTTVSAVPWFAGFWMATSKTIWTLPVAVAQVEYPNDFKAGHIAGQLYLAGTVGTASAITCSATMNGSIIGSTGITFTPGTTTTPVVLSFATTTTGSTGTTDTFGEFCVGVAGLTGANLDFSVTLVLTP